jgi:hypothetical protein
MKAFLILLWIIAAPRLAATGEVEILIDKVTVKTLGHGIEVSLSDTKDGKALILIKQDGKKIDVPASVIERIGKYQIVPESIKILTHMPDGSPVPANWLEDHEFIVSFDYGETKLHGTEKETFEVQTRGRLHIRNKKVAYFEWMVPEGDLKNRWRVYQDNIPNDDGEPWIVERMLAPQK